MNNKLFKLGALLVVLMALSLATAFGQTVYVDVTNGSDTYTGANPTSRIVAMSFCEPRSW